MNGHLSTLPNGGQDAVGSQWAAGDIMYKDLNNDGKVDEGSRTWDDHGDLKIIGDSKPHYFYGIDLTAAWKGFDFRCFLQGVIKQDFWPGSSAMFWGVRGGYSLWHTVGMKTISVLSQLVWRDMKFLQILIPITHVLSSHPTRMVILTVLRTKGHRPVIFRMPDICV